MNPAADPTDPARLAGAFVAAHGFGEGAVLSALPGGANNRVFRVDGAGRRGVLKVYFQNPDDPRDRFAHERAFYTYAWTRGCRRLPQPLGWDAERRLGLFEWIEGRKLRPDETGETAVRQAADFVAELNQEPPPGDTGLPAASEACFSIAEHLATVGRRVARLDGIESADELDRAAVAFVREQLVPAWQGAEASIRSKAAGGGAVAENLVGSARCVSPSDFGFHNALLAADGRLRFLDFEYAGWDDPAKLTCDFFCQPELPVPVGLWDFFTGHLAAGTSWAGAWRERAALLLPAYRVKWCCILLNEFLRVGRSRRAFARGGAGGEDRRAGQLEKARELVRQVG